MKRYVEVLRRELHKFPPSFGDADSVLEMLYGCYNQHNRMDTEAIKAGFEELNERMTGMPLRDMDDIVYTACTLCREHEKSGFVAGVKVGMLLAQELK
jgi:hypothetical protein